MKVHTDAGYSSQHQQPDIQTERGIVHFIKNALKTSKALPDQFWENFSFFCVLFTLMGSNGMSFLAFYNVEIFTKVKGTNHAKMKLYFLFCFSRPALLCPPRTPPGSPPSLRSSALSPLSIFSTALKGKTDRFICDVDVTLN